MGDVFMMYHNLLCAYQCLLHKSSKDDINYTHEHNLSQLAIVHIHHVTHTVKRNDINWANR